MVRTSDTEPAARRRHRRGHVDLITDAARDALAVRRAFGDPIVHGDITVIPVARVRGGNGIGFGSGARDSHRGDPGSDPDAGTEAARTAEGGGGGGGFGVTIRPLGVFVVHGDDAEWQPTLDVTKIVLGSQVLGALTIVAVARLLRQRQAFAAALAAPPEVRHHCLLPRLPIRAVGRLALAGPRLLAAAARRGRG